MRPRGWLLLPAVLVSPPAQDSLEEYQALAKVLKHFLALVSWPGSPDRALRIGILGGSRFGSDLDTAFGQGTVGGRKVKLRYLTATAFLDDPVDFDVIFIDRSDENGLVPILARTQGKPILTLGYGDNLTKKGFMVRFFLDGNRIRFEVNANRIKSAGLGISSHLLNIAKIVEG